MIIFKFRVNEKPWTVKSGSFFPKLMGSVAVSMGATTRIVSKICPDAESLAHEWYHIVTTNIFRYTMSYTIGRVWGDKYHRTQEIGANVYGALHAKDPVFVVMADSMRRMLPADWKTVTIKHKV